MDADRAARLPERDLDAELSAALAVEPSPEFLAKVRMRIAAEPAPLERTFSRAFVAAIACCAVLTTAAVALTQMNTAGPSEPGAGRFAFSWTETHERPSADMRRVMTSNAEASTALDAYLKERNYSAVVTVAVLYTENFAYLEDFWSRRGVSGAVHMSRRGRQAASDLAGAARRHDQGALETAAASLIETCDACHRLYRTRLPDDSYAIKL
jgi:hypothetical protein